MAAFNTAVSQLNRLVNAGRVNSGYCNGPTLCCVDRDLSRMFTQGPFTGKQQTTIGGSEVGRETCSFVARARVFNTLFFEVGSLLRKLAKIRPVAIQHGGQEAARDLCVCVCVLCQVCGNVCVFELMCTSRSATLQTKKLGRAIGKLLREDGTGYMRLHAATYSFIRRCLESFEGARNRQRPRSSRSNPRELGDAFASFACRSQFRPNHAIEEDGDVRGPC